MRKTLVRIPLAAAVLFMVVSIGASEARRSATVSYFSPPAIPEVISKASAATVGPRELPAQLIIPAINADIHVIEVGVTKENIMDTPHNFTEAGWYSLGTIPGQIGSAVVDAHVDNGADVPGVFKHLRDLQAGDDIYVKTEQGSQIHFKVTASEAYPYAQVPMDDIVHRNDGAYLRLITCHGTWMPEKNTYDQRLVVTAVLAE
jgi:sortase (surface protein transpeptidase)